jgi:hypothetical protein
MGAASARGAVQGGLMASNQTASAARRALLPAAGLPLLYFAFAHFCLASALGVLIVEPTLPGTFFLHPRMVALVHLVTLGWISGSILGAFYIVAPLALRLPLRPGWVDRGAFGSFALGTLGMVSHFWIGEYGGMIWSALLVAGAVLHVAVRAWRGLGRAVVPWAVKLHVALAFTNMLAASTLGIIAGANRVTGWVAWPPLAVASAHLHLAMVGWATMMFVGLAYRLIPMIVPARMPDRASMAASAVLLEVGLSVLAVAILADSSWTAAGALLVVAGLASFVAHVRAMLKHRLPAPPALARPDWATRQTHVALVCLLIAALLGIAVPLLTEASAIVAVSWIYGTLALVGFLSQVILGIQGRLLPMHAWYREFEAGGFSPPARAVHGLPSPGLARAIFFAWLLGVPLLAAGLPLGMSYWIATGSVLLLSGVVLNAAQGVVILRRAGSKGGQTLETRR